jgi:transcriptional regulator with XRE-family HTH domain
LFVKTNTRPMERTVAQTPQALVAAALRRERERAQVSLGELARRAGVAKSTISQLEAGVGNPSLETLWALSAALDVPFARLVEVPQRRVQVIRAGEGSTVRSEKSSYAATLLVTCAPRARCDLYRVTMETGPPRASDPHLPGTVEHVVLSAGRALVGPADGPRELRRGDYIGYPADQPHIFQALSRGTEAVLLSEQP